MRVAQALLTEPSDNDEIWSRHHIHELAHAFGLHLELVCVCVCIVCIVPSCFAPTAASAFPPPAPCASAEDEMGAGPL